jgi:hypothetical protein
MEAKDFTPEQSLALISQVITEAKSKFKESGFIYILWGTIVSTTSFAQFILLYMEQYKYNYYPYFIIPFGGIATWFYNSRNKTVHKKNLIASIISSTWLILGFNFIILGFAYSSYFKTLLLPVMLMLMGIGYVMSGTSIRSRMVIFSGIIINISAFVCIHLPWLYHPLLMSIVSLFFILTPGIVLKIKSLRNSV